MKPFIMLAVVALAASAFACSGSAAPSEDLGTAAGAKRRELAESGDDHGNHAGSGDDHGNHAGSGDDHGNHAGSGDDHGDAGDRRGSGRH